jgi:hypothetical protein
VLGRRVAITWLPRPALARLGFTSRFTSSLPPPLPSSSSSLPQQHHKHKHNTTSPPPSTRLSHRPRVAALLNRHSLLLLPSSTSPGLSREICCVDPLHPARLSSHNPILNPLEVCLSVCLLSLPLTRTIHTYTHTHITHYSSPLSLPPASLPRLVSLASSPSLAPPLLALLPKGSPLLSPSAPSSRRDHTSLDRRRSAIPLRQPHPPSTRRTPLWTELLPSTRRQVCLHHIRTRSPTLSLKTPPQIPRLLPSTRPSRKGVPRPTPRPLPPRRPRPRPSTASTRPLRAPRPSPTPSASTSSPRPPTPAAPAQSWLNPQVRRPCSPSRLLPNLTWACL